MTQRSDQLLQQVMSLDPRDRAEFAARLIDSLDPTVDADYVESWDREIERRVREIETGEVRPIPWEQARRVIRQDRSNGDAG